MPTNQFGRYISPFDTLRHYEYLFRKEINEKWQWNELKMRNFAKTLHHIIINTDT